MYTNFCFLDMFTVTENSRTFRKYTSGFHWLEPPIVQSAALVVVAGSRCTLVCIKPDTTLSVFSVCIVQIHTFFNLC